MSSNPLKVVDISHVDSLTGKELLEAAATQGFLFVEGHGFTAEEVQVLFDVSKQFFELPEAQKNEVPIDESNHGYTNYGGENLDPSTQKKGDPKEAMNFCLLDFSSGTSDRPVPGFFRDNGREEVVKGAIQKLYGLSIKILRILAKGLEIEEDDWFDSRYQASKPSGSTFRLLHYPGQKLLSPEAVIRAGAHTDYGSMTLLFQQKNQEGLEIYLPVSKGWEAVPYVENNETKFPKLAAPIVVNIADQLSYWTGGLLKSTIHRVKFPAHVQETGQDRYSIVFFSHPNDDTRLEPVPSEKVRGIKNRGANNAEVVITAKEHLDKRLAATYGWKPQGV